MATISTTNTKHFRLILSPVSLYFFVSRSFFPVCLSMFVALIAILCVRREAEREDEAKTE